MAINPNDPLGLGNRLPSPAALANLTAAGYNPAVQQTALQKAMVNPLNIDPSKFQPTGPAPAPLTMPNFNANMDSKPFLDALASMSQRPQVQAPVSAPAGGSPYQQAYRQAIARTGLQQRLANMPQVAPVQATDQQANPTPTYSAQHEGILGALNNLWQHTGAPVLNDIRGGLEGLSNPALAQQASLAAKYGPLNTQNTNPHVGHTVHGAYYKDAHPVNPIMGLINGLLHPAQSHQQYVQNQAQATKGIPEATAARAAMDTMTSASTYVPMSPLFKLVSPMGKFALDLAKGTVKTKAAAKAVEEAAAHAPVKNEQAAQDFMNTVKPTPEEAKGLPAPLQLPANSLEARQAQRAAQAAARGGSKTSAPYINDWMTMDPAQIAQATKTPQAFGKFKMPKIPAEAPTVEVPPVPVKPANLDRARNIAGTILTKAAQTKKALNSNEYKLALTNINKLPEEEAGPLRDQLNKWITPTTKKQALEELGQVAKPAELPTGPATVNVPKSKFVPHPPVPTAEEHIPQAVPVEPPKPEQGLVPAGERFDTPVSPERSLVPVGEQGLATTAHAGADAEHTAAEELTQAAAKGSEKNPYANWNWQSKIGGPIADKLVKALPNGIPVAKDVISAVQKAFTVLPNTTQGFKDLLSQYYGTRASGAHAINKWLAGVFDRTTKEQREQFVHLMESNPAGTKFDDPVMERLRSQIEPKMEQLLAMAQKRNLIDKTLDLGKMGVARYIPHVALSKFASTGEHLTDGNIFLRHTVDANKDRKLVGTIKQINDEHGPQFETDAVKVFGHYMHQLNDAVSAHDFTHAVLDKGLDPKTSGLAQGLLHPETHSPLVLHEDNGKKALITKAESELLSGLAKRNDESKLMKGYNKAVNGLNKMMFMSNPLLHIVNNLGFQTAMHTPTVFKNVIKHIPEAYRGIEQGSDMDRALRAGALNLSSEIGARGGTGKQLDQVVKSIDNPSGKIVKAIKGYNQLTPNVEKAYRTAVFMHAVQHGMSDAEAANYVRSIFGGHIAPNTMSAAEHTLKGFAPFINWTKTAIGSNLKNAAKNPIPYSAMYHTADQINKTATGHGTWGNPNPAAVAIPNSKDAQGHQRYYEPYFPAWDVQKLAKEIGTKGVVGGLANFLYSRTNPLVKGSIEDLTKEQNPFADTADKFPLLKNPYLPAGDKSNQMGLFFGNKGPKLPVLSNPYVASYMQNVTLPTAQPLYDLYKGDKADLYKTMLQAFTGGTLTNPNPQSALKQQMYAEKQARTERLKAARSGG